MNVIVIGAGRMGVRHIQGVLAVDNISKITIVDINQGALDNALSSLKDNAGSDKCEYTLLDNLDKNNRCDVGIIAPTADNREELFNLLVKLGCKNIMVEKPLGQSYQEVLDFNETVSKSDVNCSVNLNMRLYDNFIQLKKDLENTPQLQGPKTITINTGTIGIGANGIHYLDLLYFLLDANEAEIQAAHISEETIPSGRGANFGDFGGWSAINYYRNKSLVGTALISLSATSTVFGSWDIVAPHGRIYFNEVEQKRINTYRKEDSILPVNRYFGDYTLPVESKFESPFLGDLTAKWIIGLQNNEQLLPNISESCKVHKLMFDWLKYSKTHQDLFPIT